MNLEGIAIKRKGRDSVFKCSICGKYISYKEIATGKTDKRYGLDQDDSLEILEFWHKECKSGISKSK